MHLGQPGARHVVGRLLGEGLLVVALGGVEVVGLDGLVRGLVQRRRLGLGVLARDVGSGVGGALDAAGHPVGLRDPQQLVEVLPGLVVGHRALEERDRLPLDHGDDHRHRLGLEDLGDARVDVDVDLRQQQAPGVLGGQPLERRVQAHAGLGTLHVQVDEHRHGHRPLDDVALEVLLEHVDHVRRGGARARAGGLGLPTALALRGDRGQVDRAAHGDGGAWLAHGRDPLTRARAVRRR
ncbi:hypothetical protein GCM10025868_39270 [Angustibacter aerolatus]|uniref:Uncharacterized protein n=1 Tax=Angustibacter aerolatus TaxID=1162965 RepID=A0ABQ6JKA6_9ACTN|nr:hypothetical protein GCM10025868_39270 [Angustibacter aerolatus]